MALLPASWQTLDHGVHASRTTNGLFQTIKLHRLEDSLVYLCHIILELAAKVERVEATCHLRSIQQNQMVHAGPKSSCTEEDPFKDSSKKKGGKENGAG